MTHTTVQARPAKLADIDGLIVDLGPAPNPTGWDTYSFKAMKETGDGFEILGDRIVSEFWKVNGEYACIIFEAAGAYRVARILQAVKGFIHVELDCVTWPTPVKARLGIMGAQTTDL